MNMDERALSVALGDVRHAYRLLWSFQKRCLDTMKFIAQEFPDRQFYQWTNNVVNSTPPGRSDPTLNWAWDFLPLHNCSLLYTRTGGERHRPNVGDWLLEIRLIVDTGWEMPDERLEPDPSRFAPVDTAETTLSVMAWKCVEEVPAKANWLHDVWGQGQWPSDEGDVDESGTAYLADGQLEVCQIDISLAELTTKDAIQSFCDRTKREFSRRLEIDCQGIDTGHGV